VELSVASKELRRPHRGGRQRLGGCGGNFSPGDQHAAANTDAVLYASTEAAQDQPTDETLDMPPADGADLKGKVVLITGARYVLVRLGHWFQLIHSQTVAAASEEQPHMLWHHTAALLRSIIVRMRTARTHSSLSCRIARLVRPSLSASPSTELIWASIDARHVAFGGDLSSQDALRALHADVVRELGPIDILFVNHGDIGVPIGRHGNIEDVDYSAFERNWQANTVPAFLVCDPLPTWIQIAELAPRNIAVTALYSSYAKPKMGPDRLLWQVMDVS
jgi:NAD(P)-dependent dehydrogenase (short-subunit alcohol dehydrogenase family)